MWMIFAVLSAVFAALTSILAKIGIEGVNLNGRNGILGSHITFGDQRRGWNFVSPGHGDVDFDNIIRALNQIGYDGPLSVEWEDSGMQRNFGGKEACEFTKKINFMPSDVAFDDAIKA